jgi:hypothetical protein
VKIIDINDQVNISITDFGIQPNYIKKVFRKLHRIEGFNLGVEG